MTRLRSIGIGLWRSTVFSATSLLIPAVCVLLPVGAWLGMIGSPWSWTNPWTWIGQTLITAIVTLTLAHPVAALHRRLLTQWSGLTLPTGLPALPAPVRLSTGQWWNGYSYERSRSDALGDQRLRRFTDAAYWREVRWVIIAAALIGPVCAVPLAALISGGLLIATGSIPLIILGLLLCSAAAVTARLAWRLVAPAARWCLHGTASDRVVELERHRAEMSMTHDAEIRRIERDLHDGAQARLIAIGLDLGTAEKLLHDDPDRALALLRSAREGTSASLAELRELVRGVYPPVLVERGAVEAIRALALDSPAEVVVRAPDELHLPSPLESALYFGVAELLANAAKHAPGASASVTVTATDTEVVAVVADTGPGGAAVTPTGGLAGIRQRLDPFDGTLDLSSPVGGPTNVRITLPCASS